MDCELQKRVDLLDANLVLVSNQKLDLYEKRESGYAHLLLKLRNENILFRELETKKLGYFKNQKCADYVMYERQLAGWAVHVFELKRSVGEKEWTSAKLQFSGALQNALAIAGFLGITVDINRVCVYTAYRNDKLNDMANPGKVRYQFYKKSDKLLPEQCRDWNEEEIELDFLPQIKVKHKKIKLNIESGEGEYLI